MACRSGSWAAHVARRRQRILGVRGAGRVQELHEAEAAVLAGHLLRLHELQGLETWVRGKHQHQQGSI